MEPVQILVIHDDLSDNDPLMVSLREKYGTSNVRLEKKSSEGLKYIHNHLTSKLVVILDFDLGYGEPHAPEVFEEIRKETSLVYVIIWTAKLLSDIPRESLLSFINNNALAMLPATVDTKDVIAYTDKAWHELDTRVDCVLEQWIAKRSSEEKAKLYLTTRSGETYTLNDLIVEIRKGSAIGKRLEKGILQLAIEQLTNGDEQLS